MEMIIFEIISNGGTAKGLAYEAIAQAEDGNFDKADELLKEADEYLVKAHQIQTKMKLTVNIIKLRFCLSMHKII